MPCYHPLRGFRSVKRNPSGKRSILFPAAGEGVPADAIPHPPVDVPCGQCIGCRLERSRQWAVRCMHEASLYEENCFLTLTYDDAHLPKFGSLKKRDFQLFMKRLRRREDGRRIRYYHAGEYGARLGRPHYHALLFGYDLPDKIPLTRRQGHLVYTSELLEELWPYGRSEIGSVTFDSAAYVARYIVDKITGAEDVVEKAYQSVDSRTGEVGERIPPYTTMSRRPGIGADWFNEYSRDTYKDDSVVMRGMVMKPPKYYDSLFELFAPEDMANVKKNREKMRNIANETPERLRVREKCAEGRLNLKGGRNLC